MLLLFPNDPFEVVGVFFSVGISVLTLYAGFLGVRWAHRRMEAPKLAEGHEIEELRERVARLEECELRLAEMEERLDFTERMLAQAKPEGVLPPGKA
ncbi:MAG TPA: hypothetical protein VF454_03300 [Gemmatimonadales bacterium]